MTSDGEVMDRVWTVSNFLSILRILLVIPVVISISSDTPGSRILAAALILLAVLTDFLDGFIARRFGEVTDLGKILDPIADKVGIGAVALSLVIRGMIPAWFVATVVLRDILILAGGLCLTRKMDAPPQSNRVGKWTAGAVALTVFSSLFDSPRVADALPFLMAASTVLLALSSVLYAARFLAAYRRVPKG